jgi:hypothetical protein
LGSTAGHISIAAARTDNSRHLPSSDHPSPWDGWTDVFQENLSQIIMERGQKTVIVGAGPVGSLAALYAANRGHDVDIYELRGGQSMILWTSFLS